MSAVSLPDGLGLDDLDFTKGDGLLPVVVQDAGSGRVLMVGYADRAAVEATLATGAATFFSRSRNQPWVKGETSGNTLAVRRVEVDCDRDTLLLHCDAAGPTCHTGAVSCFDGGEGDGQAAGETAPQQAASTGFVAELDAVVAARYAERPTGSYTTDLFEGGVRRIAQKVGEEGVEAALAAVAQDEDALKGEAADLVYHLIVLLRARGLSWADVEDVLRERHGG